MTTKEATASGYGSTQFMIIKHLDSWFSNNNKDKNRMCVRISRIYSGDTAGHAEPVTGSVEGNIKRGLRPIFKGCNEP